MPIFTLIPLQEDQRFADLTWTKISDQSLKAKLMEAVSRMERKTFPTNEVLDFEAELKKQNTSLCCALRNCSLDAEVIAYMVYGRVGKKALLHKVCVQDGHRRQGFASSMLVALQNDLLKSKCEAIDLWVDENRIPARSFYSFHGFEEIQRVANYYGPGRTGLKLTLKLSIDPKSH